jgi:ubiquinone biosynthesis protein
MRAPHDARTLLAMELLFLPTVVLVALVGVRVIGVRLGWWRAVLISWLGLATSGFFLSTLTGSGELPSIALVVGVGLLAMIVWTALFELMSNARSQPLRPSDTNPFRALRHAAGRTRRKTAIALIAARLGLGRYARWQARGPEGTDTGRALRAAMEQAGGVFVKLGQFLSTRPDLVSSDIARELRRLREHVEPVPASVVEQVLHEELGEAAARFARFDIDPVGAASIAQVHRAVLDDGRQVAVKVQRPDVAGRVERDLDIMLRLADRLERRTQWAYELRALDTAQAFARNLGNELDFQAEARNLRLLSEAVRLHRDFVVPQPILSLTTGRVLVMEWVDGVPLADGAAALDEERRGELARSLLRCLLDQILVAGAFHVDPHPGNVYLTRDGRVAFIDCGAIGLLDRRQRGALQAVLAAVVAQDAAQLRDALRPMTTTSRTVDERSLERALGAVLVDHLGARATLGAELLGALMAVMREFGLALEPIVGGALRALITLEHTLEVLAPDFDLIAEAKDYGRTLVNPLWPGGQARSAREQFEALLPRVLPTLASLPRRLDRIVESVEHNELSFGVHLFPSDRDRRYLDRTVAHLVATVVPAATGVIGALLVLAANPRLATDAGQIVQGIGFACVGISLFVMLSTLVAALRQRRERA